MNNRLLFSSLAVATLVLMAGCDFLNPESTKGTVQINATAYTQSCPINANLDGGPNVTVPNGTIYTFPLANPGNHTLNFSTTGLCGASSACQWQNGSNVIVCNFVVNKAALNVAVITQGATCNILSEACP